MSDFRVLDVPTRRWRAVFLQMLPRLMLVTARDLMQPAFEAALRRSLEGGARLIQLREKALSPDEFRLLATTSQRLCAQFGATLLLNSQPQIARETGCGAHFPEREISNLEYSKLQMDGASVHSVGSAQRAEKLGADYVVFGAIFPTSSHPNEAAQGLGKLREVTRSVSIPVYAIGGIGDAQSVKSCLQNGAFGVAVRSAVWQSAEVAETVAQLVLWANE